MNINITVVPIIVIKSTIGTPAVSKASAVLICLYFLALRIWW